MSAGWECLTFNIKDGFVGTQQRMAACRNTLTVILLVFEREMAACGSSLAPPTGRQTLKCARFADAVVRGHRSGLLSSADYNNLAQCESLDDIKLNLVGSPFQPDRLVHVHAGLTMAGGIEYAAPAVCCQTITEWILAKSRRSLLLRRIPQTSHGWPDPFTSVPDTAVGDGLWAICPKSGEPPAHHHAGGGVHAAAGGPVGVHAR